MFHRRLMNGIKEIEDNTGYWVGLEYASPEDRLIKINRSQYNTLMSSYRNEYIDQQLLVDLKIVDSPPYPHDAYVVWLMEYDENIVYGWSYLNPRRKPSELKTGDLIITFEGAACA